MADFSEVPESEKTPVTIVTGFLGSGKTTLVNYILKEQNTWKICIVENEFGEVSIDDELVGSNMKSTEDIITMDNGCVCCTVRGDLVRTFGELVARRKQFDAIIIETTGLADPAPILYTFNSNSILQDNYHIDSIVCLVDAKHVNHHLDEIKPDGSLNEAEHQVAFSDRIILNKMDLVSAEELADVEERIRSINSFAVLIKATNSRAPLDQILGLKSFSLERLVEVDPTLMDDEEEEPEHEHSHEHGSSCADHACTDDAHSHDHQSACTEHACTDTAHEHGHAHAEHEHDHGHGHDHGHDGDAKKRKTEKGVTGARKKKHNLSLVSSVGFTIDGLLDVTKFNDFMSAFLKEKAIDIFRSKGVLGFADQGDVKFVFQGVHDQIQFGPSEHSWLPGEPRKSKLVFIGKNLDYDFLKESVHQCTADPTTAVVTMHKRA
jgi:G3E family GTPase